MKGNTKLLVLLATCFLSACANNAHISRVIAQNDDYILVKPGPKDSYESLAKEFLGAAKYASVIKRYNPSISVTNTDSIAIPKNNLNAAGVFHNGFQRLPILCYHQFTEAQTTKNRMVVTQKEFEEQLAYLYENNYQVITLAEASEFIRSQKELPEKAVVLTVDDGYKSFQEFALPILERYQFPSTMFVYPDFVGADVALSWSDIRKLLSHPLVDIQSHSTTHSSLSRAPTGEEQAQYQQRLIEEINQAEQAIQKRTKHSVKHFAYPYGNTSETLIQLLEQKNYDIAVTVQRGSNPAFSAPFLVNRTMIYGGDSLEKFKRALITFESVDLK